MSLWQLMMFTASACSTSHMLNIWKCHISCQTSLWQSMTFNSFACSIFHLIHCEHVKVTRYIRCQLLTADDILCFCLFHIPVSTGNSVNMRTHLTSDIPVTRSKHTKIKGKTDCFLSKLTKTMPTLFFLLVNLFLHVSGRDSHFKKKKRKKKVTPYGYSKTIDGQVNHSCHCFHIREWFLICYMWKKPTFYKCMTAELSSLNKNEEKTTNI